jgi:hypothetical protein
MIRPARPRDRRPGTEPWTGLAIDLGGSLELGSRLADGGVAYLDDPLALLAPLGRRERTEAISSSDLCVLTIELSGATAVV